MNNCYLCANSPANVPLSLKESFTACSKAKSPQSKFLCEPCSSIINLRAWYWNEGKQAWSKMFSRNWSWLIETRDDHCYPVFSPSQSPVKGDIALPVVKDLPTREQIRNWILEPPKPPFTIVIAKSGQKHLYPWRIEAKDRDNFPILFEEDVYYCDRYQLLSLFTVYSALRKLGFSKTEIDSGQYSSVKISKVLTEYEPLEKEIEQVRGSLTMALVSYLGA